MANWFARNSTGTTAWQAGNQKVVAGPSVTIAGQIPAVVGVGDIFALAPTTATASANIQDSTAIPIPDGLTVIVMKNINGTWLKEAEVVTSGGTGLVSYTNTLLPPHPDYMFVIPRQTNWQIETICTPAVTPL